MSLEVVMTLIILTPLSVPVSHVHDVTCDCWYEDPGNSGQILSEYAPNQTQGNIPHKWRDSQEE